MIRLTSSAAWLRRLSPVILLSACSAAGSQSTPVPEATAPVPTSEPTLAPTAPAPAEEFQGTLSLWLSWGPDGVRSLNELIRSFRSIHPGVSFAVAYVPAQELRETLELAAAGAKLPTLFLAPAAWGPDLLRAGLIRDLADQPVNQVKPVVHGLAWSLVADADHVLGLPIQLEGDVLYRNRELAPVPAATVEGLVESARAFRGTGAVGLNLDFGYSTIVPFAGACGGQLIQPDSPPALEGELGPCWLALLQELSRAGQVDFNSTFDREAFAAGTAGWVIDGTDQYEKFSAALGETTVTVDPWPIYEATGEPLSGSVWGETLYFRSDLSATELELAWEFGAYLISAESQQALSSPVGAGNLPIHAGSFALVGVYDQMYQAVLGGSPIPLEPARAEYVEILERAARAVAVQGTPVEIALQRALEELGDV